MRESRARRHQQHAQSLSLLFLSYSLSLAWSELQRSQLYRWKRQRRHEHRFPARHFCLSRVRWARRGRRTFRRDSSCRRRTFVIIVVGIMMVLRWVLQETMSRGGAGSRAQLQGRRANHWHCCCCCFVGNTRRTAQRVLQGVHCHATARCRRHCGSVGRNLLPLVVNPASRRERFA